MWERSGVITVRSIRSSSVESKKNEPGEKIKHVQCAGVNQERKPDYSLEEGAVSPESTEDQCTEVTARVQSM